MLGVNVNVEPEIESEVLYQLSESVDFVEPSFETAATGNHFELLL